MLKTEYLLDLLIAKLPMDGSYTWLPLTTHLGDTYEVAMLLWEEWLPRGIKNNLASACGGEAAAKSVFGFLAMTHDLGKATPDFMTKLTAALRRSDPCGAEEITSLVENCLNGPINPIVKHMPHALMGEVIALEAGIARPLASVLGAHHGRAADKCAIGDMEGYQANYKGNGGQWTAGHKAIIENALKISGFNSVEDIPVPNQPALVLFCGLVIMADWIASNEKRFPYISLDDAMPKQTCRQRAQAAWAKVRLPKPWQSFADALEDVGLLFDKEKFGFDTPNQMQLAVTGTVSCIEAPGIAILEAPMGSGKTEAALAAAELMAAKTGKSGVFFALPTQTTSNGVFSRLLPWADALSKAAGENHAIRLVHGAAHLNEDYVGLFGGKARIEEDELTPKEERTGVSVEMWFEGGKKALLADFVVGTVDQLLMAGLNRRHVMLRHVGLAGKVVIIDECHAYDTYMMKYLSRVLRWLRAYNVPTIILSATLPAARRKELIKAYMGDNAKMPGEENAAVYPLLTYSDGENIKRLELNNNGTNVDVQLKPLETEKLYAVIDEIRDKGGCLGIIVNTVKRAQEIANNLTVAYPGEDIRLFHSRFVMADRANEESALLQSLGKRGEKRPESCIIIGTQVLEQSLDIDFDVMISELCPMDLLLQRLGRLHRHKRQRPQGFERPVCHVLGAGEELTKANIGVYGAYLLKKTQLALPRSVALPKDIPALVEEVYGVEENEENRELSNYYSQYEEERKGMEVKADTFLLNEPYLRAGRRVTLDGWQNTDWQGDENSAQAAVRDIRPTLEVIALWRDGEGNLRYLSDDALAPTPDSGKAAAQIAARRLRLPAELCAEHPRSNNLSQRIIVELEGQTAAAAGDWQKVPLLKGELLLLFNSEKRAKLGDYTLGYDKKTGLTYKKEEHHIDRLL